MEKVFKFGNHEHLVGIISAPDNMTVACERPAVVFLNAGLVHRVGPYRIHVDLGRILASEGYLTMRFDLSGIGDSQFTPETREYKETVKRDIQDAMDFLQQRYKAEKFVLIGNCSGASNAHMVATVEERISGLVLMDGFFYKTAGFYYTAMKPYLANPVKFIAGMVKFLIGYFKRLVPRPKQEVKIVSMFSNVPPPKQKLADDFANLARRGVAMLCIYSGSLTAYYNYPNQFIDMFKNVDFRGMLQLQYFENADHTYTAHSERRKLIECIRQWLNDQCD